MADHDFGPTAAWPILALRAELLRRLRSFFDQRGFLEVETPLLSHDTVVDRYLDPFPVTLFDDPCSPESGPKMWLQTSPEFAMKRLLAAGGHRIYQVTKAFRGAESGRLHNPEFTMVEWYRVGDSQASGMQLLADLARELLAVHTVEAISYGEAFRNRLGVDPHAASSAELAAVASQHHVDVPATVAQDDRDEWLNLLLATLVEPRLGIDQPQILFDYPASQAALARVRPGNPPVAERFELYINGMELANGYHELLDARVLRERNSQTNTLRRQDGKPPLPERSRLLAAMEHGLPDCVGVALGFDRWVMVAAGVDELREVLAFPIDRA